MIKNKTTEKGLNKAAIVAEYLTQDDTFKALGLKYGIPERTIQTWVRAHRKANPGKGDSLERQSPREKELEVELHKQQLKNQLLEEILRISEQQTGVNLRKKYGARQS